MKKISLDLAFPDRRMDEEDATSSQLRFIRALLSQVGAVNHTIDLDSIGKWQASAIIDQLKDLKQSIPDGGLEVRDKPSISIKNLAQLLVVFGLLIGWASACS